jgi:hypothetical protein
VVSALDAGVRIRSGGDDSMVQGLEEAQAVLA